MHRIKKSIEINAKPQQVFELITTPQNLPSIWPSMIEASNVERRADGTHKFDWVYKMAGLHFKGHSESTKVETNKYSEVKNEGGIPSTFKWSFEPRGSGTLLTCEVEYEMPGSVLGKLAEAVAAKLNERECVTVLENAKSTLELAPQAAVGAPATAPR